MMYDEIASAIVGPALAAEMRSRGMQIIIDPNDTVSFQLPAGARLNPARAQLQPTAKRRPDAPATADEQARASLPPGMGNDDDEFKPAATPPARPPVVDLMESLGVKGSGKAS